jgi:hypothetical protein
MSNQVAYHLQAVIYSWAGAEAGSYGLATPMDSIWSRRFPVVQYNPEGIQRFMLTMYRDTLFGQCTRAHQMLPGMLQAGGPLQTVGNVYNFLNGCDNSVFGFGQAIAEGV